jgi:uncharacterized protein YukE
MSADGFQVDGSVLRQYAQTCQSASQQLEQIHQVVASITVSADWFGKLPDSGDLHGEYTAHAQAEVQNTSEATQLLQDTASQLNQTADSYDQTDQGAAEAHRAVSEAL